MAIEQGMKNHDLVPVDLVVKIGKLHRGGTFKAISNLHKHKLIYHENKVYDGYRLTYLGYDFLCLKAMSMRDEVVSVGTKIGVGKESDIYACAGPNDEAYVLKLARLGRISFRNIKKKRDYLLKRKAASWLYMSRLAAYREWTYMQVLHEHGLPIPVPRDWSRHGVLMDRVDGFNLSSVNDCDDPQKMYMELMALIMRLASFGLIHADFNEFNLMVNDEGRITLIDFPQMVSISHENAQWYFERDVVCIVTFFKKRFAFECDHRARWEEIQPGEVRLDRIVKASGVNSAVTLPGNGPSMGDSDEDNDDSDSEQGDVDLDAHGDVPDDRDDVLGKDNDNDNNADEPDNDNDNDNGEEIQIPVDNDEEDDDDDDDDEEEEGDSNEGDGVKKEKKKKADGDKPRRKNHQPLTEDEIRAQVRKELRKKSATKQTKSAKRQGKRQKQRSGARKVKESIHGAGGW